MSRRVLVDNARRGGLWWRIPLALLVWLPLAAPVAGALAAIVIYARVAATVPEVPDLDAFRRAAPRSSVLLAADGSVLADLPFRDGEVVGHRYWVGRAALPPLLVHALYAAEDVRFASHAGVDPRAVARAALANYRAGRTVEGASTITQQVARNLLPVDIGRERSVRRKLREMILARRLERAWSKDAILETYANLVFLGGGAYGVEAAARIYFDRHVDALTLDQAALVAGLVQAPGRTDPFVAPAAARARRDEILTRMARAGFVTAEEAAAAQTRPLGLTPRPDRYGALAPWHTERARRELEARFGDELARGGLVARTAALPVLAMETQTATLANTDAIARRQRSPGPQAAVAGIDLRTGYLELLVGGLDWRSSQFDRAAQACRQPGSTFKPIVYAAALERDAITPGTPLRDAPVSEYDEDRDVFWKPANAGRSFRGVALAQDALAASLNAPSIDVLDRVGAPAAVALAKRLGISTPLDPVRPLVLGASCVIPLELARAFGAFARLGTPPDVITVVEVRDRDGTPLEDRAAAADPFLPPDRRIDRFVLGLPPLADPPLERRSAWLMAHMLAAAARSGTGAGSRAANRPVAGKTGTTNDNSDAWFVGFTARLVVAVWVGHDDPATKLGAREDGAHAALPLWVAVVRAAEGPRPPRPVPGPPPPGIETALIDRETGKLARPGAGGALELPFKTGTAPTDTVADRPPDLESEARTF